VETYFIKSLEELRLACKGSRPELLEQLRKPMTATELAHELQEPVSRLYYHLNELERGGLVRVVELRDRANLREKVYQAIAPSIRVDPAVFDGGDDAKDLMLDLALRVFSVAGDSYRRAARRDRIHRDAAKLMLTTHNELRLAPDDVVELNQRLRALVEEFIAKSRVDQPITAALTAVLVPFQPEPS
jgi:sugar-specific transcriptional regulator TrmB